MKPLVAIVECAIEHENKFLIIKRPEGGHASGLYAFPGGKVEDKDTKSSDDVLATAARREVVEEVGLDLKDPLRYVCSATFENPQGEQFLVTVFHCKINRTNPKVIPSSREAPEHYWLSGDEVMHDKQSPPWLRKYMAQVLATRISGGALH